MSSDFAFVANRARPLRVGDLVRRTGGQGADGQLGRVVEDDHGALMVRLDRAAQELLVPLREGEWSPASDEPMTKMQMARIAYAADTAFRLSTGEYGLPEWVSLRDQQRVAWLKGLPAGANRRRRGLYREVIRYLANPDPEADE